MGQTEFIYALYEEPQAVRNFFAKYINSFLWIYSEMHRQNKPFLDGSSLGFYHIWTPGKSLWFQDDMGALLSPALYRDFFLENETTVCAQYDYTLMHLHPSAFHLLDDILTNENLKAVEINKDVGGPSVAQMLSQFRKVRGKKKNLVIWGDLTEDEIQLIFNELEPEGIFLYILCPDFPRARYIKNFLECIPERCESG